jgi:hypothetical protein
LERFSDVDNFSKVRRVSGKFGGVTGVFDGVINYLIYFKKKKIFN